MQGMVIVMGGSSAVGAAIYSKLGLEDNAVAVNCPTHPEAAEALVQQVTLAGGKAHAFQADVSSKREADGLFAATQEAFGAVTGPVNSAGIVDGTCRVDELTAAVLQRTPAVNVVGTIFAPRAVMRVMAVVADPLLTSRSLELDGVNLANSSIMPPRKVPSTALRSALGAKLLPKVLESMLSLPA